MSKILLSLILVAFSFGLNARAESYSEARKKIFYTMCRDRTIYLGEVASGYFALKVSKGEMTSQDFLDAWYWTCDQDLAAEVASMGKESVDVLKDMVEEDCLYRSAKKNEKAKAVAVAVKNKSLDFIKFKDRLFKAACENRSTEQSERIFDRNFGYLTETPRAIEPEVKLNSFSAD